MLGAPLDFIRELRAQIRWHRKWSAVGKHYKRYRAAKEKKPPYRVWWEVLRAAMKYQTLPDQYFACDLYRPGVDMKAILDYVPSYTMHRKWQEQVNKMVTGDHRLLYNKIFFHLYLDRTDIPKTEPIAFAMNSVWYSPSLTMLTPDQVIDLVTASGAERIFCKAATSNQGLNITCFNNDSGQGRYLSDTTALDRTFLESCANQGPFLLEKGLSQHPSMSLLNPTSVNTFRVVTQFTPGEGAKVLFAIVRIGRAESPVDNVCAGGCYVFIDSETGKPQDHGYDQNEVATLCHPETGIALTGLAFPFFDEIAELAKRVACIFPTMPSVGWDIAYTEQGPVVIEGNLRWSHEVYQVPAGGFAPVARREWGLG